jgi:Holliday junction resolvase
MQTPEGKVKADLKKILDGLGAYYFFPATGGYGRSGVPDVVGVVEGKFFAIECKAPGKKPTALQIRELKNIRKAGGVAFVYDGTLADDHVTDIILGVYRDA